MAFAEEAIISHEQAIHIAALRVTSDGLDARAYYTGPLRNHYSRRRDLSTLAFLQVPQQPRHSIGTFAVNPLRNQINDLFFHPRILAEAAVYDQKFWKGYFFANARSKIIRFHQAYTITQEGCLFIAIAMQSYWPLEELESYIYHQVPDSGLSISQIPDILALHPENDFAFAEPQSRTAIVSAHQDRVQQFEEEEQERLGQIERSLTSRIDGFPNLPHSR
ncbi:hypothetical protein BU25DRAFT_448025 [Macroventuria anomochaeta]|uniref:Uncharacterized protein n=1 Tax=Macroventuria anomochaeta TaxID=301207 RepID=A0ACB6S351_9PLEO|nr:uncharacterized protein BU25DRAFT_448025 [Macroventuria anomochaeta]KAF2628591.1 hypothetical protein BU25DRAFT_448025 [Macroventuria anomochaeta]